MFPRFYCDYDYNDEESTSTLTSSSTSTSTTSTSSMPTQPDVTSTPPNSSTARPFHDCSLVDFTDLMISEASSHFNVMPSLDYRLRIDDVVGDIEKVEWHFGTALINEYDFAKSCSAQGLSLSPDGHSVIILKVDGDIEVSPFTAAVKLLGQEKKTFVIELKLRRPDFSDYQDEMWKWLGVIGVVLLLSAALVIAHVLYVRRARFILRQRLQLDQGISPQPPQNVLYAAQHPANDATTTGTTGTGAPSKQPSPQERTVSAHSTPVHPASLQNVRV